MALRVQLGQSPSINVSVTQPAPINPSLKKIDFELVNLEELNNVETAQLQNGYTLVYNSDTQKWNAQEIPAVLDPDIIIDAGTY